MKKILITIIGASTLLLSACNGPSWLRPHKIDVQQGNIITQRELNRIKPGMTKNQVRFVLGTPLIEDVFHAQRWDFIYTFKPGYGHGKKKRVSLFFSKEKLARIEGDMRPLPLSKQEKTGKDTTVINVKPGKEKKKGLFDKALDKIGLGED